MRRRLAGTLLMLTVAAVGCATKKHPTPAPPVTPPPQTATPSPTPPSPVPPPGGPCSPEATAIDLTNFQGGGITLPPPKTAGTPERPWVQYVTIAQQETYPGGGRTLGETYATRAGTAVTSTAEFWLRVALSPAPSAGWSDSHLTLEGVTPLQRETAGLLQFRLPAGKAGDTIRLTLRDVVQSDGTAGDFTLSLCRQEPPRVSVFWTDGSAWRPAEGAYLPAGRPLELRLSFTADMDRPSVERALSGTERIARVVENLRWMDARTLEVVAPAPGGALRMNLDGSRSARGLYLAGGAPALYTGEPARLEAVDLNSGQGRKVTELPPEIQSATVLPGNRQIILMYVEPRGVNIWKRLEADVESGERRDLPTPVTQELWLPGGERLAFMRQGKTLTVTRGAQSTVLQDVPEYSWILPSPSGALFAFPTATGEKTEPPYQMNRFVILSADGKSRQEISGSFRVYAPGKDGLRLYGPVWSPDSTRIALTETDPAGVTSVRLADVAAGALKTLAKGTEGLRPNNADLISWSPDGRLLLVGELLFNAATGKVERRLPGQRHQVSWSPDSKWILTQAHEWGDVAATEVETGRTVALGKGLPAGWTAAGRPLVVRWPGAADRMRWGI